MGPHKKIKATQPTITGMDKDDLAVAQALYDQTADPVMTLAPPNWFFTSCNAAAVRLYEVASEEEFVKLGPWSVSPERQPDGRLSSEAAPAMIQLAMEKGSHFFEWQHCTVNGREIPCTVLLSRIRAGDSFFLLASVRDISPQREAERKLKNKSEELETILQGMSEGLVIQNEKGEVEKFNQEALNILGLSAEQLIHRTSRDERWKAIKENGDPLPGDEHPAMLALRENRPVRNFIMGLTLPSSEERWIKINSMPMGQPPHFKVISTFNNITDIIRANRDVNRMFTNSRDLKGIVNFEGVMLKASPSFVSTLGWSIEEIQNKSFRDFIHPEDAEAFAAQLGKIAQNISLIDYNMRLRTKSGDYRLISWRAEPDLKLGLIYASGRDVTDLVQAEADLETAQEIAKVGSWRLDLNPEKLTWSKQQYQIFEIDESTPQEILKERYLSLFSPSEQKTFDKFVAEAVASGQDFVFTYPVSFDNGSRVKHIRSLGKVIKDVRNRPIAIAGTSQDLTELVALQEQNKLVLEATGIGIWKFNPITQDLFWDESMYRLFGVEAKDFNGHYQAWESCLTPESKAKAVEDLTAALKGEREFDSTFEITTRAGVRKHIGGRAIVVRNEKGEPLMMYGINWDRTADFLRQKETEEAKQLLQSIIDASPSLISVKDALGRFVVNNKSAAQKLGRSPKELIGKTAHDFYSKEVADSLVATERAILFTGEARTFERQIPTEKGNTWELVSMFPIHDSNNRKTGVGSIITNIQATKDLQQKYEEELAIERSKSIQSAKLASLGEMSAGVAHEINNPLAHILGTLPLLGRFKTDEDKFAQKINALIRSSERIEKIVKGLKKFSRTTTTSIRSVQSLNSLVQESIVITESKAKRHSTQIAYAVEENLFISCDPVEIEQVFINLINNAIDAVKELPKRWVRILIETDKMTVPEQIIVRIMDSGPGIPFDIEHKLFQPFFTTKPVGEGTGLGLSIAKGILESHKAEFFLNRNFKNTCFEIRFARVDASSIVDGNTNAA